jgi:hypothetical protein
VFPYRTSAGRISYKYPDGTERGRETFTSTTHGDGMVVRAYCEMDAERLIRDATWTLGPDFAPIDGFVRVLEDGEISGTCAFRVDGAKVHCESITKAYGKISQTYESDAPIVFLGLHPVMADGLIGAARGVDRIGEEVMLNSITCSFSVNGETGMLAHPISIGVRYLGEEDVTVEAGTFGCRHYAINWQSRWAPADYWVHGDDFTFVKMYWSEFDRVNELTEYKQTPAASAS